MTKRPSITPMITRRNFGRRTLGGLVAAACLPAASANALPGFLNRFGSAEKDETREIGLDLWAGSPTILDGEAFNLRQGSRIKRGPEFWKHPITRQTLQTYLRINREPDGEKSQRFAIRSDGQALGRVFDVRPGQAARTFVNDAFFPLGVWSRGESRDFEILQYRGSGEAETYIATIRIRRLSFTYRDVPNSLRYDWILRDRNGTKIFDERFEFSPGIGFVNFTNRMTS